MILAKTAGFCFGVRRAMETVYQQIEQAAENGENIYTLGPIIHNEEVVKELQEKGVNIVEKDDDLKHITSGSIVIRSHGVGEAVYRQIEKQGLTLIDATCPFVKKIHHIVKTESEKGKTIIIVGDEKHPEVQGIIGWCKNTPITVNSLDDLENIHKKLVNLSKKREDNIILVAQTTFNSNKFKELVEFFRKKYYNVNVYNTICNATEERQKEAKQLASSVDAMIVIGGKNSSNTRKLYEISQKECKNTYYIQTLVDLDLTAIESVKRVGITAGASTPNHIIKEVHDACQN